MDHADHVALIRAGVEDWPGAWADVGSGTGAFTLALADLLAGRGSIVSVDRDGGALTEQRRLMEARFPAASVRYAKADFTADLGLSGLDGILMANSLHFVRERETVLRRVIGGLRPGGRFVLVEYDSDHGNPYVPHPLSFATWQRVAPTVGLAGTRLIGHVPSRFLGAIYAAVSELVVWTSKDMGVAVDLEDKEAVRRALEGEDDEDPAALRDGRNRPTTSAAGPSPGGS